MNVALYIGGPKHGEFTEFEGHRLSKSKSGYEYWTTLAHSPFDLRVSVYLSNGYGLPNAFEIRTITELLYNSESLSDFANAYQEWWYKEEDRRNEQVISKDAALRSFLQ